ncbi:hypothetical protein B0J11DRAFT_254716 [Dendryphion nanum]|uniref:F-box domain-containing protein n=1 Tax=Dendryphion nanum TaxID=256645 RepID=A0A9P9ITN4_9PLEO|nr:hypothetical protein B0J11DRAFT_254716 [Dendryphion nanum]
MPRTESLSNLTFLEMESLPTEVLLYIFESLQESFSPKSSPNESSKNLAQVCLTCRRFQDIATPLLYRDIDLYSPSRVARLLDTLILHPNLINHVKKVRRRRYFRALAFDSDDGAFSKLFQGEGNIFTKELPPAIERLLYKFQKHEDTIISRLNYSDDPIFAILIFLLPQLEDLSCMIAANFWLEGLGCSGSGKISDTIDSFQNLRSLCVELRGSEVKAAEIPLLFRMPTLVDLTIIGFGSWCRDAWHIPHKQEDWPVRSATIERLTLTVSYCHVDIVSSAVRTCKALKSFQCTGTANPSPRNQQYYTILSSVLLEHADTLKTLVLNDTQLGFSSFHYERIMSTNNFVSLETFELPFYMLVGWDNQPHEKIERFIPPKITTLMLDVPQESADRISGRCFDWFFLALCRACLAGQFLALKKICIRYHETLSGSLELGLDFVKLREMFLACDVSFDVCVYILHQAEMKRRKCSHTVIYTVSMIS